LSYNVYPLTAITVRTSKDAKRRGMDRDKFISKCHARLEVWASWSARQRSSQSGEGETDGRDNRKERKTGTWVQQISDLEPFCTRDLFELRNIFVITKEAREINLHYADAHRINIKIRIRIEMDISDNQRELTTCNRAKQGQNRNRIPSLHVPSKTHAHICTQTYEPMGGSIRRTMPTANSYTHMRSKKRKARR
jgi:hypothetical protein